MNALLSYILDNTHLVVLMKIFGALPERAKPYKALQDNNHQSQLDHLCSEVDLTESLCKGQSWQPTKQKLYTNVSRHHRNIALGD